MSTRSDELSESQAPAGRPVALVTGVSRKAAIGAAICRALCRDGWDVAGTGYRPYDVSMPWGSRTADPDELVEELRAGGAQAVWVEADLTAPNASRDLFDRAEAIGPVRALVNCAAHSTQGGLMECGSEEFDRHMAANARATLLLSAEFARRFREPPGCGRIVNFVSGPPLVGEIAYAASKGAIEWLTFSAAGELASRGITVNAVNPGPNDSGWMDEETATFVRDRSPMGRIGTPDDVGGLVAFLCSDAARWITAQILTCDGGWERLRV
jgi:3-oxoacyl-[acyl-carrier protein] reductase